MSYTTVNLDQVAQIESGSVFPNALQGDEAGDLPFAKVSDISRAIVSGSRFISTAANYVSSETSKDLRARPFPPHSIVFAKIGEAIRGNRRAITTRAMLFDNNVMGVTPSFDLIDRDYLYFFLQTKDFFEFANTTAVPSLRKSDLAQLQIPLPPLPEQRRIALILDAADALRQKRRQALRLLDQLSQSIFIEMFGDPVANPKGWNDTKTLGECADIASGVTKGRNLNGKASREIPYLAVYNVQDKSLKLDHVKTIEATDDEIERYRLKSDDLLLTEGGDPDKLGRGTLWNDELPECIHQNHVFRVRLHSKDIEPLFLNWLVGSQRGKSYFLRSAKQTTGIASINMTQLRAFPLLTPPIKLQTEFKDRTRVLHSTVARTAAHAASLEALFAAFQHRAFRGEL